MSWLTSWQGGRVLDIRSATLPAPLLTSDLREGSLRQRAAAILSLDGCGLPTSADDALRLTPTGPPVLPAAFVYPELGAPQ